MSALLSHSRLACFRSCPRKHFLRYECGLRPIETSTALRVGQAFHRALEVEHQGGDIDAAMAECVSDAYDLAIVAAMFCGHRQRWESQPIQAMAVELPFEIPLLNPQTGAPTPIWNLAGVIDRIAQLPDGRLALMEHKTTTRDFSPGADYWVRLHLDAQLSIYIIAARKLGYDIRTILYDVTRRPLLRPYKATPEADRKYTKAGALYANQHEADETPEEFAARVRAAIDTEPDKYFARIEIARLDQDLDECAYDLWRQQKIIRDCQLEQERALKLGKPPTLGWNKNPDNCFTNSTSCEFLSVCQSNDQVGNVPSGFVRIEDIHPELQRVTNGD